MLLPRKCQRLSCTLRCSLIKTSYVATRNIRVLSTSRTSIFQWQLHSIDSTKLQQTRAIRSIPATKDLAFIVDADQASMAQIQAALQILKRKGNRVKTTVFGEPRRRENSEWKRFMREHAIAFEGVDRHAGADDPNDTAIASMISALVADCSVGGIALLATDTDFVPVLRNVNVAGKKSIVFLPRNKPGMVKAFKNARCEVVVFSPEDIGNADPKARKMAILQSDGRGSIQDLRSDAVVESHDMDSLIGVMKRLQYLERDDDPITPAIAKFWYSNDLGPLGVWPMNVACSSLESVLLKHPNAVWQKSNRDLAFVLPLSPQSASTRSKQSLLKYGTAKCAAVAIGGGPFLLRDSQALSEDVLTRMQYLDSSLNASIDEAVDVFCNNAVNTRALWRMGLSFVERGTVARLNFLRSVFLSCSAHGFWQIPPRDTSIRAMLVSKKLLSNRCAPSEEVLEAMQHFLNHNKLRSMRTYHGCVWQCTMHMNRNDPQRRREQS